MNYRFWMRIEKDLRFNFENKTFGCQTKIFVPKSIITGYGVGWVDRTSRSHATGLDIGQSILDFRF
ncbi:MAG: hypothetical protein EAZ69_06270 [Oscillatoriales cyanobacterium]|nr:MAG: hypothetical protein EAZ69_06270 [Oscillatoriales cyanobacterium]